MFSHHEKQKSPEELPLWDAEADDMPEYSTGGPVASEKSSRAPYHKPWLAILMIFLATITANASYDAFRTIVAKPNGMRVHCGATVEEAQDRGCVYDVMANAWTPRECYFPTLAQDFLALPNSTWFYDASHEQQISMEVLREGNILTLYPHSTHHDRHCLYTWRKLSLAAEMGGLVDTEAGSVPHTKHCTDYMAKMGGQTFEKPIETSRKFIGCMRLGSTML